MALSHRTGRQGLQGLLARIQTMWTSAIFALLVLGHVTEGTLRIGSFNVQRLYDSKAEDPTVVTRIAQILVRYDIAVIQEVMHTSAMQTVLQEVNRLGGPYRVAISEAMGRTSYKEHVAFLYRTNKVSLRNTVTYPDHRDSFERPPYSALFHSTSTDVTDFAIMGVHLKPDDVLEEMNSLVDAYEHAARAFHTEDFLIAGDFNADCNYLSTSDYHHSYLWTDDRFYFLVNAAADTTASHNTNCAYDRYVSAGAMRPAVVSGSVHVYNFETAMHLTYDQARDVSDHYPVELQLR